MKVKKTILIFVILIFTKNECHRNKLYDFFRKYLKLDDIRAKIFTEILYESIENNTTKINTQYKSELQSDLQKMEMQLRSEIKDTKTDMIKWFFAFFVALVLMILGLYATILLK